MFSPPVIDHMTILGGVYNSCSFYDGEVLFLVVLKDMGGTKMAASTEYLKLQTVNIQLS